MRRKASLLRRVVALALLAAGLLLPAGTRAGGTETVVTNLTLLQQLAEETLAGILDSLDVQPGQRIFIEPAAYHEANWMVAGLLARLLRRRGIEPVILDETPAPSAAPPPAPKVIPEPPEVEAGTPPVQSEPDTLDLGEEELEATGPPGEEEELFGAEEEASQEENGEDLPAGDEGEEAAGGFPGEEGTPPPASEETSPPAAPGPAPRPSPDRRIEGEVLRFRVMELGVRYPSSKRAFLLLGRRRITRLVGAHLLVTHLEEPGGTVRGVASGEKHVIDRFPGSLRPYVEGPEYPFTPPRVEAVPWGRIVEPAVVLGIVTGLVYLFYANQS